MKKNIIVLFIFMLLLSGCKKEKVEKEVLKKQQEQCEKVPTLENGEEAVVTFDDGNISANDLYLKLKETEGISTLINMINKRIYEKEFSGEIPNAKEYSESTIRSLKEQYGDKLDESLRNYGYKSIEAYKEILYISYLQDFAIKSYLKDIFKEIGKNEDDFEEWMNNVLETQSKEYVEAIQHYYKKYNVEVHDTELEKQYHDYLKNLQNLKLN